jgi:ABC-type phosphate transport system substrate-binding protein
MHQDTFLSRTRVFLALVLFWGLLASACARTPDAGSSEDIREVTIFLPQSLTPLRGALNACGQEAGVSLIGANPADLEESDLAFSLGEPPVPADFSALLAWERIVAVVSPDTPHDEIGISQIKTLFWGHTQNWAELGGDDQPVLVWVLPGGNDVRLLFDQFVLGGARVSSNARVAPNPEAMLETIRAETSAIGYLPAAWVDETIEVIATGVQLPVLALSAQEPQGAARDVLLCLQGESGQAMLAESYILLDEE